jgi:hypothetical protein
MHAEFSGAPLGHLIPVLRLPVLQDLHMKRCRTVLPVGLAPLLVLHTMVKHLPDDMAQLGLLCAWYPNIRVIIKL